MKRTLVWISRNHLLNMSYILYHEGQGPLWKRGINKEQLRDRKTGCAMPSSTTWPWQCWTLSNYGHWDWAYTKQAHIAISYGQEGVQRTLLIAIELSATSRSWVKQGLMFSREPTDSFKPWSYRWPQLNCVENKTKLMNTGRKWWQRRKTRQREEESNQNVLSCV